jgi:hypothetical protein
MTTIKSKSKIRVNRRGARAEAYERLLEAVDRETDRMSDDDQKALLGELITALEDRLGPKGAPQE